MVAFVSQVRFLNRPLSLRVLAEGDYAVMIDGMTAGRILRTERAAGRLAWLWTVTGPYCGKAAVGTSGEAEYLAAARTSFRTSFDGWLAWANIQPRPVAWHG